MNLNDFKDRIINGYRINKEDATFLFDAELELLCSTANQIRGHFCGNIFDVCSIINGKSGRCPENCKFCVQSAHYKTTLETYPLLNEDIIMKSALKNYEKGILRFSIVTSGKRLSDDEVGVICRTYSKIKKLCGISLCSSNGLLDYEQFIRLKESGVESYHCNLETSRRYFSHICTTHTYDDKINAIRAAQKAGLAVCSGGIIGIGEAIQDRIDMAFELRGLGIKSVPLNILNPIEGTPFEKLPALSGDEIRRTVAVYRLILPDAFIRLAGGRNLMPDRGKSIFLSGANAAISGSMLTTKGTETDEDMIMLKELGFEVRII